MAFRLPRGPTRRRSGGRVPTSSSGPSSSGPSRVLLTYPHGSAYRVGSARPPMRSIRRPTLQAPRRQSHLIRYKGGGNRITRQRVRMPPAIVARPRPPALSSSLQPASMSLIDWQSMVGPAEHQIEAAIQQAEDYGQQAMHDFAASHPVLNAAAHQAYNQYSSELPSGVRDFIASTGW